GHGAAARGLRTGGGGCRLGRRIQGWRRRRGQLLRLAVLGQGQSVGVDRQRDIEGIGLVAIIGGSEDARPDDVDLELLRLGLDGGDGRGNGVMYGFEAASPGHRGGNHQYRLWLGLHDGRGQPAVVDVRDRGDDVLQVVERTLDKGIGLAVDIQVAEAIHQVPAVLDVIGQGEFGQLSAAAIPGQTEGELLVVAAPIVVQLPYDLGTGRRIIDLVELRLRADDGERAVPYMLGTAGPADFRAGTERLAAQLELDVAIVRTQGCVIGQTTEVVEHVVHLPQVLADRHGPLDVATAGAQHAEHHRSNGD